MTSTSSASASARAAACAVRRGRRTRVLVAALAAAAGLGVVVVAPLTGSAGAATATPTSGSAAPASLTLAGTEDGGTVELTVTVTGAGQAPLGGAAVGFFVVTTEFGPQGQRVPLGTASTNAEGIATLAYQPTVTGAQRFVAELASSPSSTAAPPAAPGAPAPPAPTVVASATTTVDVTTAQSAYHPAPAKPFAPVGKVFVVVLLGIVFAIWLTLALQVVRVRRACLAGEEWSSGER